MQIGLRPPGKKTMTTKINDDLQSNPAVLRCCEAYSDAYDTLTAQEEEEYYALDQACKAYRQAMPPLLGVRNIRNFLVCATHGFAIGAIKGDEYSRFLYAVQVAYSARRARSPKAVASKQARAGAVKGGKTATQEPFPAPAQTDLTALHGVN